MTDPYGDIEAKLLKVRDVRAIEHAIVLCERGAAHGAIISRIAAEDEAESERSINLKFTRDESASIFTVTSEILQRRLSQLKAELA